MKYEVQQADIDAYNADGVVALRQVVDEEWRQKLADAIEDDIREPGPYYHGYESDEETRSYQCNGSGRNEHVDDE